MTDQRAAHRDLDRRRRRPPRATARRPDPRGRGRHHLAPDGPGGLPPAGPRPRLEPAALPALVRELARAAAHRRAGTTHPPKGPAMSSTDQRPEGQHPPHGPIGYLQLPALRPRPLGGLLRARLGLVGRPRERRLRGPRDDRPARPPSEVAGRRGRPGALDLRRRPVAHAAPGDGRRRAGPGAAVPRRRRALARDGRRPRGQPDRPRRARAGRRSPRRCSRCTTSRPRAAGTSTCSACAATTAARSTSGSSPAAGWCSSCTRRRRAPPRPIGSDGPVGAGSCSGSATSPTSTTSSPGRSGSAHPSCGHRTATRPRATARRTASSGSATPTATRSWSPARTARPSSRPEHRHRRLSDAGRGGSSPGSGSAAASGSAWRTRHRACWPARGSPPGCPCPSRRPPASRPRPPAAT